MHLPNGRDEGHDLLLKMQVEADQRFVEQQESRRAEQRLRQQQALQFAAGEVAETPGGEGRGADRLERGRPTLAPGAAEARQAPASAVAGARDKIAAPQRQVGDGNALLRQIAGVGIAAPGRRPNTRISPAAARSSRGRLQQRRLAGAVRAKNCR